MKRRDLLKWGGGLAAFAGAHIAGWKWLSSRRKLEIPGQDAEEVVVEEPLGATDRDVRAISFSLDGSQLVSVTADRKLSLWNPDTEAIVVARPSPHRGGASEVSYLRDGSWLAAVADDAFLSVWNPRAEEKARLFRLDGTPTAVAIYPLMRGPLRSAALVAVSLDNRTIRIFENGGGSFSRSSQGPCCGQQYGILPDDVGPFRATQSLRPKYGGTATLAFSGNGQFLGVASGDDSLQIWFTDGWREVHRLSSNRSPIRRVAFTPDGGLVAAGGEDGSVVVWDWQTSNRVATVEGGGDGVADVAFAHDKKWIIVGYTSGAIRVWPCRNPKKSLLVAENPGKHTSISISADGRYLASSWGVSVRFWRTADLLAHAREQLG